SPDFLRQRLRVDEIADPQSAPGHLIFVGRAYAAGRCSDAPVAELGFDGGLEHAVIGKNQMTSIRYEKAPVDRDIHRGLNCLRFFNQCERIEHDAATNDTLHIRLKDSGRYQVKDMAAVVDAHRVSGVVAALVSCYAIKGFRKDVDNLAFSFVAPLDANNCEILF